MDVSSMTMSMPTSTSHAMSMTSMSATSTTAASSGMSMAVMGNTCKIAMTWNWYTVGACFISKSWQITSSGMFAGSCIGVIFLVTSLEFLRRLQREYNAWCQRKDLIASAAVAARHDEPATPTSTGSAAEQGAKDVAIISSPFTEVAALRRPRIHRMTLIQRQVVRSLFHMVQFAVAYFIMLMAMYYNGYIIICIIIGAFLGYFIFTWDQLLDENGRHEATEVTGCCG